MEEDEPAKKKLSVVIEIEDKINRGGSWRQKKNFKEEYGQQQC